MPCSRLVASALTLSSRQVMILCLFSVLIPMTVYWKNVIYMNLSNPQLILFTNASTAAPVPHQTTVRLVSHPKIASTSKSSRVHTRTSRDGAWIRRPGIFRLYVYSAFYDDRPSLKMPVIRVIAVSQDISKRRIYCKMVYQNGTTLVVPVVALSIGAGVYKFGTLLKESVFSCALNRTGVPSVVSIVDSDTQPSAFYLRIEVPKKAEKKGLFAACVSVTYWHQDPYRIVEWMELQRLWGVEMVTVYNNSLEAASAAVFQHYAKEGFVDFRQSHNFVHDRSETAIHLHMSPVINDCMYRNMYRFHKILVVDLDEMIVPRKHGTIAAMLAAVDSSRTKSAHSYIFRNVYFFTDFPADANQPRHLTTMRYRWRLPTTPDGVSVKSIIDPLACTNMHNHYCWGFTSQAYGIPGSEVSVHDGIAANQHYKKCHFDSYNNKVGMCATAARNITRDDTMLKFKDKLLEQVDKQLGKLKLNA